MPFSESPGDLQRMLNTLCNNSIERKLKVNKFIALELWKFDLLWYYGKTMELWEKKLVLWKQEAHGPHRSPMKPVNINKHIYSKL